VSTVADADVNTAIPLVGQPDEAEVLATRPMSYVLAVDTGNIRFTHTCPYQLFYR